VRLKASLPLILFSLGKILLLNGKEYLAGRDWDLKGSYLPQDITSVRKSPWALDLDNKEDFMNSLERAVATVSSIVRELARIKK